ncbi:thiopeptide-type bacteriocin biosynthesis protein [Thermomonospora cellulosilytica]|uniref:Thiopeptide-type bacteriocin biosynthesis protein n=1 Tax=Thermomonospora cellulosilytica TaxID=1411118 RepID=A0A7W3MVV7_9ACTN|nr:thiopeptide-type bacteriocin biosynthesis protein [Thermomonospora cellulosilytica]MBA9002859.1 thiopeptide-type bacteriocin biosynthesis protein [Thermomonospora cellulosilytica]
MPASHLTDPATGTDAVPERLSAAGQDQTWWQIHLQFTDWQTAEHTAAARLAPLLDDAVDPNGAWWFIRKHPTWRLRLRPAPHPDAPSHGPVPDTLDQLVKEGVLERWWTGRYEPETTAFGGPDGMAAAHALFTADSHAILHPVPGLTLGRRELSMLLCGALMHGAGLEPYEIGDVWAKVAHDRPFPADIPRESLDRLTATVTTLLRTDTRPAGAAFGPAGPLAAATPWAEAFHTCGKALARLARNGLLERGLREILAYHVIFHWNRAGLNTRQQSLLAHAARAAILGPTPQMATRRPASSRPASAARIDRALRHFPLIPRPRLTCPPLPDRIQAVRDHADAAAAATDPDERIDHACSAWNLAALIASDSGLPGLAADLSWQQYEILLPGWPMPGRTAIAALQPLINLARLHGRARRPERMYQALTDLGYALDHGGSLLLHDTTITLDGLTTPDNAARIRAWYQDVLAQDGTRALAATGDWTRAVAHAALHDPAPERLREARQTRVIALILNGDHDRALALLDNPHPADRDDPVNTALRALLDAHADRPHHTHLARLVSTLTATMSTGYAPNQGDGDNRSTVLFRIRLAQIADDLGVDPGVTAPFWERLTDETLQVADAYAARDALATPSCRATLTPDRAAALTDLTRRAALTPTGPPTGIVTDLAALTAPLKLAAGVLIETITDRPTSTG